MDAQPLYIDTETGKCRANLGGKSTPVLAGTLGTRLAFEIAFLTGGEADALPSGSTGRLVLKPWLDPDGTALYLDVTMEESGTGEDTRYSFAALLDSEALRTALGTREMLDVAAQVTWQLPDEEEPRKSLPFHVQVTNDWDREAEAPDPVAAASFLWLVARLLAGTNVALTVDEEEETITISSTGGGGDATTLTPRSALTGGAAGALDAIATAGGAVATGNLAHVVSGGVLSIWQLQAGTTAEDAAAGVVRPDDYNGATNARVWIQMM